MIRAEWTGVHEFAAAVTRVVAETRAATRAGTVKAAHTVETAIKDEFQGSHKPGQPHQGGDSPNVATGTLRRSVRVFGPTPVGPGKWEATVGPTTVYGRAVELGLWQAPAVKYPYVAPGFAKVRDSLPAVYAAEWRRVFL